MKSAVNLKIPARKTNNQASFSGSILKNNMEMEGAMGLLRHLDETGLHKVYRDKLHIKTQKFIQADKGSERTS
jgi:hypothetical protein